MGRRGVVLYRSSLVPLGIHTVNTVSTSSGEISGFRFTNRKTKGSESLKITQLNKDKTLLSTSPPSCIFTKVSMRRKKRSTWDLGSKLQVNQLMKVKKHKCTEHSPRAERPAENAVCLRFAYLQFTHMRKRPCTYMKCTQSPWRRKSPSDPWNWGYKQL